MTTVRVTGGYLNVASVSGGRPDQGLPGGGGPVDPGWGIEEGRPDQGLPGMGGPVDPGYGYPLPPIDPGFGVGGGHPSHPIVRPPTYPIDPGYGLPVRPGVWPMPPKPVDPDYGIEAPIHPSHPIYPVRPGGHPSHPIAPPPGAPDQGLPPGEPGAPDQGLPPEGGTPEHPIYQPGYVWPPLPPSVTGTAMCFCWIVGVGYRWVVIDCSGSVEHPIAPGYPGHPSHPIYHPDKPHPQPPEEGGEHPSTGPVGPEPRGRR